MKASEANKLITLIGVTYSSWKNSPISPVEKANAARVWSAMLVDIPYEAAEAALIEYGSGDTAFAPTPGQLREIALGLRDAAIGDRPPDPDEAWEEIQAGVRARGFQQGPPDWSHPCVASAVKSLTWRELCISETLMADRAHFKSWYPTILERHRRETHMHPQVSQMMTDIAIGHKMPELSVAGRDTSNDAAIRRAAYDRISAANDETVG
jgi:hypothetical protein